MVCQLFMSFTSNEQLLTLWVIWALAEQRCCHKMAQIWQTCYSPAHSEVFMRNVATVPLCENPLGRLTKGPDYFPGSNISQSVAHNCSKLLQGVSLGQISLNEEKSHLETSFLIHYLKKHRLCILYLFLWVFIFKLWGFTRFFTKFMVL